MYQPLADWHGMPDPAWGHWHNMEDTSLVTREKFEVSAPWGCAPSQAEPPSGAFHHGSARAEGDDPWA